MSLETYNRPILSLRQNKFAISLGPNNHLNTQLRISAYLLCIIGDPDFRDLTISLRLPNPKTSRVISILLNIRTSFELAPLHAPEAGYFWRSWEKWWEHSYAESLIQWKEGSYKIGELPHIEAGGI
jgi:hypothetical protein